MADEDDKVPTRQIGFAVSRDKEYQVVYGISASAQVDRLVGSVAYIQATLKIIAMYNPHIMIAVDIEEDKLMTSDEITETFVCS